MIINLQKTDCQTIARLHLKYLQTQFQGKPGLELLTMYYKTICDEQNACGYTATQDNQIIGYVCGVWNGQALQKLLIRNEWFRLFFWTFMQGLTRPQLTLDFLLRPPGVSKVAINGYELRPIVVIPEARGNGISHQLVNKILLDAANRGYKEINLYTEESNRVANAFYQKIGFEFNGLELRYGQTYRCYKHSTENLT